MIGKVDLTVGKVLIEIALSNVLNVVLGIGGCKDMGRRSRERMTELDVKGRRDRAERRRVEEAEARRKRRLEMLLGVKGNQTK